MDQIEKIRQEIERHRQAIRVLNEHTAPEQTSKTCAIFQYSDAILSELLSFIESSQEENRRTLFEKIAYPGSFEEFVAGLNPPPQIPEMKTEMYLEEAADEYEKEHTYQRYDGGGLTPEYDATLAESFIAGAEWQANQGVKATGTISPRGIIYDNNIGYRLFLERYHNGDKVKVQIRKIEENGK